MSEDVDPAAARPGTGQGAPPPVPARGWAPPSAPAPPAPASPATDPSAPPAPAAGPTGTAPSWGPPAPPAPPASGPSYPAPAYPAPTSPGPSYPAPSYPAPPFASPTPTGPAYAGPVPPGVGLPGVAGWGAVPVAPKPGVVPLRPLGLGEILDGAVSYIRRDPRTVLGISAVLALVTSVLQFASLATTSRSLSVSPGITSFTDSLSSSLGSLTESALRYVVGGVVGVVATGLLTVVMGQAVLGRRVTAAEAWRRASPRFWPLIGLTVVVTLLEVVGGAVGIGLAALVGVLLARVGEILGVSVGVLLGLAALAAVVWVHVRLLLAPVALVLEGTGVTTALRRSWALVGGAWWRTGGIYLLGTVLAGIASSVLAIPFTVVGTVASLGALESGTLPLAYTVSVSLATLVSGIVVIPFSSGVVALLYVDRRIRREALDLELVRAAGVGG